MEAQKGLRTLDSWTFHGSLGAHPRMHAGQILDGKTPKITNKVTDLELLIVTVIVACLAGKGLHRLLDLPLGGLGAYTIIEDISSSLRAHLLGNILHFKSGMPIAKWHMASGVIPFIKYLGRM